MADPDARLTALVLDGHARLLFVQVTGVARELARRHDLRGRAMELGAELAVANVLLGAWIKGEERVQLQLQAEDPKSTFLGEVDADGVFRGRFSPRWVRGDGLAVRGMMLAIKADAAREMYRGVTSVMDESVADALARHLRESGQVPASVRIDVVRGRDGIERAVGLVAERLPVGDEEDDGAFRAWMDAVMALEVDALVAQVDDEHLAGQALDVLELWPLRYQCRCSRPKVEGMLLGLGADTLREMRDEDHGAEVTCSFCAETYTFTEPEVDALIARVEGEA